MFLHNNLTSFLLTSQWFFGECFLLNSKKSFTVSLSLHCKLQSTWLRQWVYLIENCYSMLETLTSVYVKQVAFEGNSNWWWRMWAYFLSNYCGVLASICFPFYHFYLVFLFSVCLMFYYFTWWQMLPFRKLNAFIWFNIFKLIYVFFLFLSSSLFRWLRVGYGFDQFNIL